MAPPQVRTRRAGGDDKFAHAKGANHGTHTPRLQLGLHLFGTRTVPPCRWVSNTAVISGASSLHSHTPRHRHAACTRDAHVLPSLVMRDGAVRTLRGLAKQVDLDERVEDEVDDA